MLQVVYQTKNGPQTDFEKQYWNEWVLAEIPKEINYDNAQYKAILPSDENVIVYSTNNYKISADLDKYIQGSPNPVLIHLSNEGQNHDGHYYKNAKAVLRTAGWNPNTAFDNVFTIPLGFQSGYMNQDADVSTFQRDLIWVFAGAIKQDRQEMLDALLSFEPNWYFKSSEWGSSDMKTTEELITFYKRAIFAPTPFGNINYECFRTMESLEWGCIPVTTEFLSEDCYKYVYGDHPFIVGKDWADVAGQMKVLVDAPELLKQKQQEVWKWYQNFKSELQSDVAHILNGDFDVLKGRQFEYQRNARHNRKLRWRFFKHFTLNVYWKRIVGKAIKSKNG